MLAKGVLVRWPDLPEAAKARELLQKHDANPDAGWQQEDIAEQRRFLVARARGLDAYARGPLPKAYAAQQANMTRAAINLWKQVIADGQDKAAVEEAQKRLPALEKALDSTDN